MAVLMPSGAVLSPGALAADVALQNALAVAVAPAAPESGGHVREGGDVETQHRLETSLLQLAAACRRRRLVGGAVQEERLLTHTDHATEDTRDDFSDADLGSGVEAVVVWPVTQPHREGVLARPPVQRLQRPPTCAQLSGRCASPFAFADGVHESGPLAHGGDAVGDGQVRTRPRRPQRTRHGVELKLLHTTGGVTQQRRPQIRYL
mmetsp:Transcript_39490/g.98902  ORF Transcript_39490/g.98902 Transcript_39490/m.98902 type:complete len:206 (-) Transcript_39490:1342-1959(-)